MHQTIEIAVHYQWGIVTVYTFNDDLNVALSSTPRGACSVNL